MTATVLIVDDEDGVRRTFHEWLAGEPGVTVLAAADAEAALRYADGQAIDLAVLDWNLGSGLDGLRLLEDLTDFLPDIVAILVTGFANQATPLDALRMGVRDYLDKNSDLTRESFLAAVRKQLARIAPAKREREVNRTLGEFRDAVQRVLPLVQGSAALNDPVPLPAAIHALFRFLLRATGATDGALVVRHIPADGPEAVAAYAADGSPLPAPTVPFARSLAATVVSLQEPCVMTDLTPGGVGPVELLPFEVNRKSVLATALRVGTGAHVVLELFDKPEFTAADKALVAAASDIGGELLRQALAERQTQRLLFDAVDAALKAGDSVTATISTDSSAPPPAVLERLRRGLAADPDAVTDADTGLRLIEAVRAVAVRHGPAAVDHCVALVDGLRKLLDGIGG